MEEINHRTVQVNGISMHIAEKGDGGPVVLLLHGFPELWYSWRHQIIGLAEQGYHAVAPDLRGYGDTSAPTNASAYSAFHLVGDVVALIDVLGQDQVFVVGHDWGAMVAWYLCMFRPEKVKALVNLSVQFMPRNPATKLVDYFRTIFGDDFYVCKFQEPGKAEAAFSQVNTALLLKIIFTTRDPTATLVPKASFEAPDAVPRPSLPSWLSEEDVNYFASKFEESGFTGGLNYYRCLDSNWELTAPWTGAQVKVPAKFIVGDLDLTYHFPGVQDYLHEGGFKKDVPLLEDVIVMEGVGHFINQEKPQEITQHIINFINKF